MKILSQLDPRCPQGFTTEGAALFFLGRITTQQARAVFRRFPVIACIQCEICYWLRRDLDPHDPNCGAYRACAAIQLAVATPIKPEGYRV